jgi:hypothetical protein
MSPGILLVAQDAPRKDMANQMAYRESPADTYRQGRVSSPHAKQSYLGVWRGC